MGNNEKVTFLESFSSQSLPKIYSPSKRLPLLSVLETAIDPDTDPRQPHDNLSNLISESHIARAVFDRTVLPLLTDVLSARRSVIGPHKKPERVVDKVAGKLGLAPDQIDEYKASQVHFGLNCDYTRSMQPVGTMDFVRRASDIFQGRGVVSIDKGDGSKNVDIIVLDVENGFVKEVGHKPNLMRINLKLAVPITLKDGTETFHVLEHKILLKASLQNEMDGCKAWGKLRTLDAESDSLSLAFERAVANSPEADTILNQFLEVSKQRDEAKEMRAEINLRDHAIKGIHALTGHTPTTKSGSVRDLSWTFTPMEEVVSKLKAEQRLTNSAAVAAPQMAFA